MFENTIRRMPRPQDVATLTTQQLRDRFAVTNLFAPGELRGLFTNLDRLIVGGVIPLQTVELPSHKESGHASFLELRELGAVNISGPGDTMARSAYPENFRGSGHCGSCHAFGKMKSCPANFKAIPGSVT